MNVSAEREPAMALTADEIHIWLAFYDQIDEGLSTAYRTLLSEDEKAQEPRFYFPKDRWRYLVTRTLVRTVLSKYAAVPPSRWMFSANRYGRPEIANAEALDAGLSFNISHTHSLIVLGVTRQRALGVDVENVGARQVSIDIADRYFAPDEVTALAATPKDRQLDRFFEYWTFKESYIKARGMGLSIPLDQFSFHFPYDNGVEIAIRPELNDAAARWRFWQWRPTPEYLVAMCAERSNAPPSRVVVRRTIPTVSEELISPRFLRTSAM